MMGQAQYQVIPVTAFYTLEELLAELVGPTTGTLYAAL